MAGTPERMGFDSKDCYAWIRDHLANVVENAIRIRGGYPRGFRPVPMRRIREAPRLKHEFRRSHREIARSLGIANSTVSDYVGRAIAGIGPRAWPPTPTTTPQAGPTSRRSAIIPRANREEVRDAHQRP